MRHAAENIDVLAGLIAVIVMFALYFAALGG